MCVATGPPIRGTLSVSHRCTYPLNPSPMLSTLSPKQPAPDKETNKSKLNTSEPIEHWIIPCTLEGTLQPSQLRFPLLVFTCQCG